MTLLKLLLIGMCLVAALYIIARWVHRALYEQIPSGLAWRAATAAGIIWLGTLLLPFAWNSWRDSNSWPITLNDLFLGDTSAATGDVTFQSFRVQRGEGQVNVYRLNKISRGAAVATAYTDENGAQLPVSTLKMTGVAADGSTTDFSALLNDEGNIDRGPDGTEPIRYQSSDGRIMLSTELGKLSTPSTGYFWKGLFLFTVQVLVWAACLALVLQFLPSHALLFGLAGALLWVFVLSFV